MAFSAKRKPVVEEDRGFVHYNYTINVFGTLNLDRAVQDGAPQTELEMYERIAKLEPLFPEIERKTVQHSNLLLVSFGKFMHQDAVWEWARKNNIGTMFAHPRALLAFATEKRTFCRDIEQKRAGLVTFRPLMPYLGQKHVFALYFKETPPTIERKVRLDPYACGWAAHHWFCFELPK